MSDIEDTCLNEDWDDLDEIEDEIEDEMCDENDEDSENQEEDDDDGENDQEDYEIEDEESGIILHNTFSHLTKYEKTKILGIRAKQIEMGASPLIKYSNIETPLEIAERELYMKKIPFKIKRTLPSGKIEIIKLKNLC